MINRGKRNILGVLIDAVDYEGAVDVIIRATKEKRPAAVLALAVHGLMTGLLDREQKFRLNHFDLLVPDGQPLRWAINALQRPDDCGCVATTTTSENQNPEKVSLSLD